MNLETEEVYVPSGFATSPTLAELATALVTAQGKIGSVTKSKRANAGDKYSYMYADLAACLEEIREPLTSCGLAVLQGAFTVGNRVTVTTRLIHKSGEWVESALTLAAKDASPQAIGSAITYGRRYGVSALVGLAAEDDDGKAAQPDKQTLLQNELPAKMPPEPDGYRAWVTMLEGVAEEGTTALQEAWSRSSIVHRDYLTKHYKAVWTAFKDHAATVKAKRMTIHYCLQRSPEWYRLRAGRLTSTGARALLASGRTKGSESVGKRDLKFRLVCEQLTGIPQDDGDGFKTDAMLRGEVKQDDATDAYEALTGCIVRRTGFCAHDELAAGCSLDGDVDDMTGIIEIKCPKMATHIGYIRAGGVPEEYIPQITHHLWITGAQWCDFVSFDDRFPPELSLYVARMLAPDVTAYEITARAFLTDVAKELAAVEAMRARVRA